jgi:hypothetical protein
MMRKGSFVDSQRQTQHIVIVSLATMKFPTFLSLLSFAVIENAQSFSVMPVCRLSNKRMQTLINMSEEPNAEIKFSSPEEKEKVVGNLVQDDEWNGLGMELADTIRMAIASDIKQKTADFIGKEDYNVGDVSKEIDTRVKDELARMRGKEKYELGDFIMAMDEMSKTMTEELTGKPYESGDLSKEIDTRVKSAAAKFCGKDSYEFGDLSATIDERVKNRVSEFTGKGEYEFGDIAREVESRRQEWAKEFLGEEAAANYEFGDLTKQALSKFTGKDDYQFGDVTKKLFGNLFAGKKKSE